jgi:hypothetical protein
MKQKSNGNRLEETTALLQQAMATSLTKQTLFIAHMRESDARLEKKFAEIDQRFVAIEHRLDQMEALMQRLFTELPERVFGFGQAAAKKQQT